MINQVKQEYVNLVNRYKMIIVDDKELMRVIPSAEEIKIALQNLSDTGKNDLDRINNDLEILKNQISIEMRNNNVNTEMVQVEIDKNMRSSTDWIKGIFEEICNNFPYTFKMNNPQLTREINARLIFYANKFTNDYEDNIKKPLIQTITSEIIHNIEEYQYKQVNDNNYDMNEQQENLNKYNQAKQTLEETSPINKPFYKVNMVEELPSNILL